MFGHLTSGELRRSYSAVDWLWGQRNLLKLDPVLATKLSTLRSDLAVEVEDRQGIERESSNGARKATLGTQPRC